MDRTLDQINADIQVALDDLDTHGLGEATEFFNRLCKLYFERALIVYPDDMRESIPS